MRENITSHRRALRAAAERAPKTETVVEIAEPRRPRFRLLLDRDTRVTENGNWSLSGRKGRLDGVWMQRFAARVVRPEYVTVISTYGERKAEANQQAAEPVLKWDTNGKTIVPTDTVVWETEDGLSHHAGYVSERQDNDDIDVRVQPLGAAGDTYVVIKARRLRIAKQGNEGNHTVADLVDMADALEYLQPKPVKIPPLADQGKILRDRLRAQPEDDGTEAEALAPVEKPKTYQERLNERLTALGRGGVSQAYGGRWAILDSDLEALLTLAEQSMEEPHCCGQ